MRARMEYQLGSRLFRSLLPLGCIALLLHATVGFAAPRIVCDAPVYDFGHADQTEPVVHAFTIWNRGDTTLKIGNLRACCGASMTMEAKTIAPGSNTQCRVTLSLNNRRGKQDKRFFIASNDPKQPYYSLRFVGTVNTASRLTPRAEQEMQGTNIIAATNAFPVLSEEKVDPPAPPVIIDFFHEPGCPACRRIEAGILPDVLEHFGEQIDFRKWDVSELAHVLRLLAYQDALDLREDHPVLIVVDYQTALPGVSAIENRLREAIEVALTARMDPAFEAPVPIPVPDANTGVASGQSRMDTFGFPAILAAGLIDGLNPCAIAALTFLMSLLAAAKVKGSRVLLLGLPYCLAAFLTYMLLGLGLLRAFHLFHAMPLIRWVVEILLIAGLVLLAALSFRDAWRFGRSHRADAVQVKLPKSVMRLSHAIMRRGVRTRHLVLGGFVSGMAVTAVESVCTGQLYVPTLALMIRLAGSAGSRKAWGYLLAYNTMFMVPLVTVFLLVWAGLRNESLQQWSKRHVVPGKIAMGLLMLALATGLVLLRVKG